MNKALEHAKSAWYMYQLGMRRRGEGGPKYGAGLLHMAREQAEAAFDLAWQEMGALPNNTHRYYKLREYLTRLTVKHEVC